MLQPFLRRLPWALGWPLRGSGLVLLVAWGLLFSLATLLRAGGLVRGLLLAYCFHLTRWTALGHDDVPGAADFRGFFEDVVGPLTRFVLATVWVTAPLVILLWGFHTPASPIVIAVFVLAGLALVPISFLASAIDTPLRHVINPLLLGAYAVKLGADYLGLLAFCAVAGGLHFALSVASGYLSNNFLVHLFVNCAQLVFPFAFFRALGLLLRARGDDLGWGRPEDYLVPVLGEHVKPEAGHLVSMPGRALGLAATAALADERAVATGGGHHLDQGEVLPIEMNEPAPRRPALEPVELPDDEQPGASQAPLELVRRLREGNTSAALDLLERGPADIPELTLSAEGWFMLGRTGFQDKRFRPALVALRRAIDVAPEGPLSPQAWLLAARLYDEGLQDRAQSDKLLGELARRFPASAEGQFAARRLGAPRPSAG